MNLNSDNHSPGRLSLGDITEYKAMACEDAKDYFVVKINGHWICLEFLDDDRDELSYYYFHPSGYVGWGPHAAEDGLDKGLPPSHRPTAPEKRLRGKYGQRRHRRSA